MGSIVPGAGAVPGAEREDPGEGSRGRTGRPASGEIKSGEPRIETGGKKMAQGQLGRMGGGGGGRCNWGGKQVAELGGRAEGTQRGKMERGRGQGESGLR